MTYTRGLSLNRASLTDGRWRTKNILKPKSPYVGKLGQQLFPVGEKDEIQVVAIFRQGHTLLPHAAVLLQAEDRLLAIATPAAWETLEEHFSPFSFAGQGPYSAGS
jgi:Trk K+ transport system NAD-binding subunit